MKYIRTLQNLKKIMDNAPELVTYNKDENKESYSYTDNEIDFSIEIENEQMQVLIHIPCMFASLDYLKKDGEWELDVCCCIDMAGVNRKIRSIVKRIKANEYIPVSEEAEKVEQSSDQDNARPIQINQDNYTPSSDDMEEACNENISIEDSESDVGIEYPAKERIVESEVIDKAIREYIHKVRVGKLQKDNDSFYQVLDNNEILRLIEFEERYDREIFCSIPNDKNNFIIELHYDYSADFGDMINRIDYHVEDFRL